jgi:hypothetical protein
MKCGGLARGKGICPEGENKYKLYSELKVLKPRCSCKHFRFWLNGFGSNCIMTNIMHKFLIYLSIYFCLRCFGLSFSLSSEACVQFRQLFKSPGYAVSARALTA